MNNMPEERGATCLKVQWKEWIPDANLCLWAGKDFVALRDGSGGRIVVGREEADRGVYK